MRNIFSHTALQTYAKCPEQWRRRYVEGHKIAPGFSFVRGRAAHEGHAHDLRHKREHGRRASVEELLDITGDAVKAELSGELTVTEEERQEGIAAIKKRTLEQSRQAVKMLNATVTPILEPKDVERKHTMRLQNLPGFEVVMYPDLVTHGSLEVHDLKVVSKSPSKDAAETSTQLTLYSLGVQAVNQAPSQEQQLTHVVMTRNPKIVVQRVQNTAEDQRRVVNRAAHIIKSIQAGSFPPAPEGAWWCSRRWCGYYDTCPFVRGGARVTVPLQVAVKADDKEGGSNAE